MKPKQKLGLGIYVRKDIDGRPIHVGDTVRITRPSMQWKQYEGSVKIDEQTWVGEVRLTLSGGVKVFCDGAYIKAPITDNSRNKWSWELLKSFDS